jgi:hypothetical protein
VSHRGAQHHNALQDGVERVEFAQFRRHGLVVITMLVGQTPPNAAHGTGEGVPANRIPVGIVRSFPCVMTPESSLRVGFV